MSPRRRFDGIFFKFGAFFHKPRFQKSIPGKVIVFYLSTHKIIKNLTMLFSEPELQISNRNKYDKNTLLVLQHSTNIS